VDGVVLTLKIGKIFVDWCLLKIPERQKGLHISKHKTHLAITSLQQIEVYCSTSHWIPCLSFPLLHQCWEHISKHKTHLAI